MELLRVIQHVYLNFGRNIKLISMFYWPEFIKEINSEVKDGDTVLDAGAGDGHWKRNLKGNFRYIAMDMGVGDATIDYSINDIKGDLRSIPLSNDSIDIIICIQVLEHLPEPWNVLAEFRRVLKPGGYVFASCPQGEPQHQVPYDFFRYTIFGLEAIFKSHGFTVNWIRPQKGNFSKIAIDLRHSSTKVKEGGGVITAFILKLLAKYFEIFFKKLDQMHTTNTVGHFIKAAKKD
jgi:ubiquinone/menaquinone biosynthesis C-methylase UbiE